MSLAPLSVPDRQTSPRLTVNLGSNNPFRNRTASPSSPSPSSPSLRTRPLSTNPFLDDSESVYVPPPTARSMSPSKSPVVDPPLTGHAAELFANLSLDNPSDKAERAPASRPSRPENIPPKPPMPRRPSRQPSREASDHKNGAKPRSKPAPDVFADPPSEPSKSRSHRRPRRNSDSSVVDPEEERRRRERRHREREARHRDGKSRSSKKTPSRRLDLIDKLDVTGIYGGGSFHHDGPFDACNPHRNRKGLRAAPMQAFPKDSRNMALGGAGPNNSNIDLNQFHGRGEEGYTDFGSTVQAPKQATANGFDPASKLEPVHGAESMGLGTSTFLDGAPASRAAMQRRQSENDQTPQAGGGLQRKKSLAQKIRGINNRGASPRMVSPEPVLEPGFTAAPPRPSSRRRNDKNPFYQDYDKAYDSKGAKIQEATEDFDDVDDELVGRTRSTSSPKVMTGGERRKTSDANDTSGNELGGSGGFMNRVKSLRRPRPEKRTATG